MTWFHVFLAYRDIDGAICYLIQYDIASTTALHAQIIQPLQEQRPFILDNPMISPLQVIQYLQVYESTCPFAMLRLPDGSSPIDHQPDTLQFLFERGVVDKVELYTPEFLPSLPHNNGTTETALNTSTRPDSILIGLMARVRAGIENGLQRWLLSPLDHTDQLTDRHFPHIWLYYILCGYAALGNTVLTNLVRWVETGPHPTWLHNFLRNDATALVWPMLTSMLLGIGLLATYYVAQWRGLSRGLLTLMNGSLLTTILATNLATMFSIPEGATSNPSTLMIYIMPYLVFIGIVAVITFTLATRGEPKFSRGTSYRYTCALPLRLHEWVLLAATSMTLIGAVSAYLRLSTDYRIAYPLWFSYLFGGIILWSRILRSPIGMDGRDAQATASVFLTNSTVDGELPALPRLDTMEDLDQGLPVLPSLDPR